MGSAEDEFTPLSQLKYGMDKCKVQGKTMQARVEPGDIERFEHKLVEGQVYALSDFHVDVQRDYYMSCSNEWTMYIRRQTVVTEIEGDIDSIPLYSFKKGNLVHVAPACAGSREGSDHFGSIVRSLSLHFCKRLFPGLEPMTSWSQGSSFTTAPRLPFSFEFVNFKDLRSRCGDNSLLTDVLGHVVGVGELQEVTKRSRVIEICNASIRDLRGKVLGVTLYGDIASGFAEDMAEKGKDASVVAVFAGMSVDSSSSVCSTTSSEYYLDLEIPEVQEFRANLRIQQANPVPKKTPAQKLAESWRTIEQLKKLDPEEYDEDTTFLCRVSLIDIDCSNGWCYLGCDTCQKSMYGAPRKYKCARCGPIKRPVQWYKLKAKVEDATGTMDLMIFCEVAEELVGVSAEELVDNIEEDDEWYALPDEIEDLLGSTHTFQVFDKYVNGSFAVRSIMDDASVPAPAAAASQCKEKADPEGSQKPSKRLRGDDDSIN
ncbi:replication protein A 70 kDa DNA-binding subunit A isoform X2 [Triticum aestivum]|uniref:replication protein A 70 kDa DNA-binding subunit A isoform X2 n=1 Tax=Triticum aestivum TaxID=4565 RepID=UPI001D005BB8|nr:replication protein A 70 kDa DNA-binding subunit A-like isoform X2 [Triticum aestivum]